jgi:histidinol phosphatase-like enzyme (inositol monophosphatase family)
MRELSAFLDFAMDVAWRAGRRTLAHYQTGVHVERKADQSAVTIADRDTEHFMRACIAARYPDHAIVGEEFGADEKASAFTWLIDPIDGTSSFVRGVPFFGVLMGLLIEGSPAVGVCYFPALDELLSAATGLGCRWNGRPARVSAVRTLADACVTFTDAGSVSARLGDGWHALERSTAIQRGWGDCYGHCLVATGRAEVMLDPRMNPWDCAALVPILEEAGGRFTDWRGRRVIDGGDAVSTNAHVHTEILARLSDAASLSDPGSSARP